MHSAQHSQPSSQTKQQHRTARLKGKRKLAWAPHFNIFWTLTRSRDIPFLRCLTSDQRREAAVGGIGSSITTVSINSMALGTSQTYRRGLLVTAIGWWVAALLGVVSLLWRRITLRGVTALVPRSRIISESSLTCCLARKPSNSRVTGTAVIKAAKADRARLPGRSDLITGFAAWSRVCVRDRDATYA